MDYYDENEFNMEFFEDDENDYSHDYDDDYYTNIENPQNVVQLTDEYKDEEFIKEFMEKKPQKDAKLRVKKMNKKLKFEIIKEPFEERTERTEPSEPIEVLEDDTYLPPQLEYGTKYISKEQRDMPSYFRTDIKMYDRVMFNYQDVMGIVVAVSPDKNVLSVYNLTTHNVTSYRDEDIYDIEMNDDNDSNFETEDDKKFFIYQDNRVDITQIDKGVDDDKVGRYISFKTDKPNYITGRVIGHTPDNYIISVNDIDVLQVPYNYLSLSPLKKNRLVDIEKSELSKCVTESLREYSFNYLYSKLINFIPDTIIIDKDIDVPSLPEKDVMILNMGITPFKESEIKWDDDLEALIFCWEYDGDKIEEVVKYHGEIVDDLESQPEFILLKSNLEERAKNNFYDTQLRDWLYYDKHQEFYDKVFFDKNMIEKEYESYIKKYLDHKNIINSLLTRYGNDFLDLNPGDMVEKINQEPNVHEFDTYLKLGLRKFPNYVSDKEKVKAIIISQALLNFMNSKEKDPIKVKENIIQRKIFELIQNYEPTKNDIKRFEKEKVNEIHDLYRNKFKLYLKSLEKKQKLDNYIDNIFKNKDEAKIKKDEVIKEVYNNIAIREDYELTPKGLKILKDVKKLEEQIYDMYSSNSREYISKILEPIIFFDESDFEKVTEYYQQSLKSGNIDIKDLIDLSLLEYFPELLLNKKNLDDNVWDYAMKKINIIEENANERFEKEYLNSKFFGKRKKMEPAKYTVFNWTTAKINFLIPVTNYCKFNTKNNKVGNYPLHNIYLNYNEEEDKVECYLLSKIFSAIEKGKESKYPLHLIEKVNKIIENKNGIIDKKSRKMIFTKKNQILNYNELESEINFSDITAILIYNENPESLKIYDLWNDFFYGRPHIINYAEIFSPQYDNINKLLKSYKISKKDLPKIIILNQQGKLLKKIDPSGLTKHKLIGLIQNVLED